jgi:hypothetical protein
VSFVFYVLKCILSVWFLKSILSVLFLVYGKVILLFVPRGKGEHADPFSVARRVAQNIKGSSQTCYCSISCCFVEAASHSRTNLDRTRTIQLFSRTESRSLSELTRQITPPTKNGHAPYTHRYRERALNLSILKV